MHTGIRAAPEVRKPSEQAPSTNKDLHVTRKTATLTATAERAVRDGTCVRLHTPHSVWGGPRVHAPLVPDGGQPPTLQLT